jgi:hypothetical protein
MIRIPALAGALLPAGRATGSRVRALAGGDARMDARVGVRSLGGQETEIRGAKQVTKAGILHCAGFLTKSLRQLEIAARKLFCDPGIALCEGLGERDVPIVRGSCRYGAGAHANRYHGPGPFSHGAISYFLGLCICVLVRLRERKSNVPANDCESAIFRKPARK